MVGKIARRCRSAWATACEAILPTRAVGRGWLPTLRFQPQQRIRIAVRQLGHVGVRALDACI